MNRRVKIAVLISIIGILSILALQALWMYSSYRWEQKKLVQKATPLVEQALSEIFLKNSQKWWEATQNRYGRNIIPYIASVNYKDSLAVIEIYNPATGLYNKLEQKNNGQPDAIKHGGGIHMLYHVCGLDIGEFDLKLDSLFHKNDIYISHITEKVNTRTGKAERRTDKALPHDKFTVLCDTLHLGITGTDGIVVKFDGSYSGIIAQVRLIILSSFVITLLVAVLIFCTIRILLYQQKLSEFRENFVRHMVHEIKNPIVYLKRVLELSARDKGDKLLHTAYHKIDHINLLTEKLLTTSSNKLVIRKQEVDIRAVLENIRASYPDTALHTEIAQDIPTFRADPVHYGNALRNLVDNAVKYAPEIKRILIRCEVENGYISVSVRDWGMGIPLEFQPLIFERYFRVPPKKSVDVSGFGLGLSYVKMVAEAHGGDISFMSVYRQGSEFTIRIPYDDR